MGCAASPIRVMRPAVQRGQRRQAIERPLAPLRARRPGPPSGRRGSRPAAQAGRLRPPPRPSRVPCQSSAGDDDDGDLGAAAHRIVHDVHARASATGRPPAPPAARARRAGMTVRVAVAPTNCGPHRRADGTGARSTTDRRRRPARGPCTSRPPRSWPARPSSVCASEASAKPVRSVDARLGRRRREQRRVQIAAMRHPVGCAVPCGDPARRAAARPSVRAVRPSCTSMASGSPTSGRSASRHPEPLQHAHAVGSELNAGARRRELRRAAPARSTLRPRLRQRQRQRQAADAAACDQDRRGRGHASCAGGSGRGGLAGLTRQPAGSVSSASRRASCTYRVEQ